MIATISIPAVILAMFIDIILGVIWYSPKVFGNTWMKYMKMSKHDMQKKKPKAGRKYMWSFIISLFTAFILAHFIAAAGADFALTGGIIGFWIWLGFISTTTAVFCLYEDKPLGVYFIFNGYKALSFILMGAVLAVS